MLGNITKRFCHHHSRSIPSAFQVTNKPNPLVECEKPNKPHTPTETHIYVDNYELVHNIFKVLPKTISKVTIHLSDNSKT
jgi:hypothetical protein